MIHANAWLIEPHQSSVIRRSTTRSLAHATQHPLSNSGSDGRRHTPNVCCAPRYGAVLRAVVCGWHAGTLDGWPNVPRTVQRAVFTSHSYRRQTAAAQTNRLPRAPRCGRTRAEAEARAWGQRTDRPEGSESGCETRESKSSTHCYGMASTQLYGQSEARAAQLPAAAQISQRLPEMESHPRPLQLTAR